MVWIIFHFLWSISLRNEWSSDQTAIVCYYLGWQLQNPYLLHCSISRLHKYSQHFKYIIQWLKTIILKTHLLTQQLNYNTTHVLISVTKSLMQALQRGTQSYFREKLHLFTIPQDADLGHTIKEKGKGWNPVLCHTVRFDYHKLLCRENGKRKTNIDLQKRLSLKSHHAPLIKSTRNNESV